MAIDIDLIKQTVTKSITNYVKANLASIRSFQVLDLLIPKERKIRSIVGGIETSLGRTLWEPLAKTIAVNNGFTVVENQLEQPLIPPASISQTLQLIFEARFQQNGMYDAAKSHKAIKDVCQQFIKNPIDKFGPAPKGHGVDIWLNKDGIDYFFDTKTVQPNIAKFRDFLTQLYSWYSYYYSKNPNGNAEARIVFPYNPYLGDFWQKSKGNGKPLEAGSEGWVEDEFWDFLSGEKNTFSTIKMAFDELREEGIIQKSLDTIFLK